MCFFKRLAGIVGDRVLTMPPAFVAVGLCFFVNSFMPVLYMAMVMAVFNAVRGSFTNYMSCPDEVIGGGGRGAKFGHGCVP